MNDANTEELLVRLSDIANSLDAIESCLNPKNEFGYTVGDQLYEMTYNLSRIADSLEKIAQK